ncbi:MAG TPA: hypothetical protein EYP29_04910 [Thermoplasmata archaeon]|nr:hypothetical protein [Thermoplasmata archaeon]
MFDERRGVQQLENEMEVERDVHFPFSQSQNKGRGWLLRLYTVFVVVFTLVSTIYLSWFIYSYLQENEIKRTEWAFEVTGIEAMNNLGLKGDGVVIGIIDTGIDLTHRDLKDIKLVAWKDFINGREEPYDDNGHGTHVAGILAANGKLKGGAPEASFIIAKALNAQGNGEGVSAFDTTVANAIDFCVENGADIISLSLGGNPTPFGLGSDTERATRNALRAGVFVVAAAGNDGDSQNDEDVSSPGNIRSAISVGSIDRNLRISSFSSRGDNDGYISELPDPADRYDPNKKPEFVAPGEMILSTYPGDRYVFASGTSQSVPFVSAVLALILESHPEYKRDGEKGGNENAIQEVKNVLMSTANPCPGQETPHDDHYGYGIIDPLKAIGSL